MTHSFFDTNKPAPAMLAPMAGAGDLAFRELCVQLGAAASCTEMVSAKALCFNDKKTASLLLLSESSRPCAAQIFGSDPETMAEGARRALEISGADWIDINMGCPAPKIVKNGDGSALMRTPKLAGQIVSSVCKAVNVPVTVKFRAGWDEAHKNAPEFARILEASGASALCIHGRTTVQLYSGSSDREIIRQTVLSVKIPVIANGDVRSAEDAGSLLDETGAAGIAVGRGALGNPWIFSGIRAAFSGQPIPDPPTLCQRMEYALRQISRASEVKGEHSALLEARRHFVWYLKHVPGSRPFRVRACSLTSLSEAEALVREILSSPSD